MITNNHGETPQTEMQVRKVRSVRRYALPEAEQMHALLADVNRGLIQPMSFTPMPKEPSAAREIQASIQAMIPEIPSSDIHTYFAEWERLIAKQRNEYPFDGPYVVLRDLKRIEQCALLIGMAHVRILATLGLMKVNEQGYNIADEVAARLPSVTKAVIEEYYAEKHRSSCRFGHMFDPMQVPGLTSSVLQDINRMEQHVISLHGLCVNVVCLKK